MFNARNQPMIALLSAWGLLLTEMAHDETLQKAARQDNAWFTPAFQRMAMEAVLPWFAGDVLARLRARYPQPTQPKRIGLILAGNLPLVGLHDVLMTLLSGHEAVVKPSHKDRILLHHLLTHSPKPIRDAVHFVEQLSPTDMNFLIATGSNATARQVAAAYPEVPKCIRRSKFSIAVLGGNEDEDELRGLVDDCLRYHGLGCRSVSAILVPAEYRLERLARLLEAYPSERLAPAWAQVVRYETALAEMVGELAAPCSRIALRNADRLDAGSIGRLQVVRYHGKTDVIDKISAVYTELQVISLGIHIALDPSHIALHSTVKWVKMGEVQSPPVDDFADGIDTLAVLTQA